MLARITRSLSPRSVPLMTRQSYRYELVNAFSMPVAVAMVEGGVAGVLAKKAFDATPWMFAAIMAAPMFANLTSLMWARIGRGIRKVRLINLLQLALMLTVAAIALLPVSAAGALMLTGLVVVARCLIAGIVTIRSTVWRLNYPRTDRARITGRLALVTSMILALAPLATNRILDLNDNAFRLTYPLAAMMVMVGMAAYSRIRLRREKELLAYERRPEARPQPHGEGANVYEYDPRAGRYSVLSVLRHDPVFRQYMFWQFLAGASNMMVETVVVYVIAELTRGHPYEYSLTIFVGVTLPLLLTMATLPLWAGVLDRVHITQFRVRQAGFWVAAMLITWLGAWAGWLWLIAVGRTIHGVARGGGMLAWNLGHNDFADRRLVALYMGVHQLLTGIRGAFAPFLGLLLYAGGDALTLYRAAPATGPDAVTDAGGLGPHVFVVAALGCAVAGAGFYSLYHAVRRKTGGALPED